MPTEPPEEFRPPGAFATLRAALNAGLATGAVFGVIDGVVAGRRTGLTGAVDWIGCLSAAVFVYGLAWVGLLLVASPVLHVWLRRRTAAERLRSLLALGFGGGLFFELFWWSRELLFWGVPATDPKRLAASVAFLLVGLGLGRLVVRLGRGLPRAVLWGAAWVVPIAWLVGIGYLYQSRTQSAERGAINPRNRDLPNVLLFVVDALRQDTLGCYGDPRAQTPVIDGLAERGVLFENALVQAPFTWSSFGSFLTGKYPRRHGLVKMAPGVRMAPNVTLPWHLKGAAFVHREGALQPGDLRSGTFMTGTLSNGSGLMRGFDAYYEALVGHERVEVDDPWSVFRSELVLSILRNKVRQKLDWAPVAREAVDWLREGEGRRFVAMVHYYSTHTPYDPPARFRDLYVDPAYDGPVTAFYAKHREAIERGDAVPTEADVRQIRDLYYGGVTQADAMIGRVLEELERQGVLDRTLVIVTSDHGEELGDHGVWEHNFMFQTNLKIPLVMCWPDRLPAGKRVSALVESVDLVPTVCELLGVVPPYEEGAKDELGRDRGAIDGVSLVPLIRGEVPSVKRYSFAENGRFASIQDAEWKLIVRAKALTDEGWRATLDGTAERPRLFHLATDPDERTNLWGQGHEDVVERLHAALVEWDASMPVPRQAMVESHRDREAEARLLRALGYADGVGQGMDGDGE